MWWTYKVACHSCTRNIACMSKNGSLAMICSTGPEPRCLLNYPKAFFETPHCVRWRVSRSEYLPRGR